MKGLEMWHVLLDEKTGQRSCYHGDLDALTFNLEGKFQAACEGKTELSIGEWTEEELCEITTGWHEGGRDAQSFQPAGYHPAGDEGLRGAGADKG